MMSVGMSWWTTSVAEATYELLVRFFDLAE
jgi:hypothetical protein